jgi:hypothetical protein
VSVKSPGSPNAGAANVFTANQTISKVTPALILRDTSAGADEKEWRIRCNTTQFLLSLDLDTGNVNENAISVSRTGAVSVALVCNVPSVQFNNAAGTLGFFGVTPQAQPANASQATITATWVAISAGFGFLTSDQAVSIIAAVKQIQFTLKTLGLWKGAA